MTAPIHTVCIVDHGSSHAHKASDAGGSNSPSCGTASQAYEHEVMWLYVCCGCFICGARQRHQTYMSVFDICCFTRQSGAWIQGCFSQAGDCHSDITQQQYNTHFRCPDPLLSCSYAQAGMQAASSMGMRVLLQTLLMSIPRACCPMYCCVMQVVRSMSMRWCFSRCLSGSSWPHTTHEQQYWWWCRCTSTPPPPLIDWHD